MYQKHNLLTAKNMTMSMFQPRLNSICLLITLDLKTRCQLKRKFFLQKRTKSFCCRWQGQQTLKVSSCLCKLSHLSLKLQYFLCSKNTQLPNC